MKGMVRSVTMVATALLIPALALCQSLDTKPAGNTSGISDDYLISLEQQRRERDFALAKIKSPAELATYLGTAPKGSPLFLLSTAAKSRFLNSLTFNENGLTGFDYSDLQAELSASQIYEVLSLFGMQRVTSLIKGARIDSETDRMIMAMPSNMASPLINRPGYGIGDDHEGYRCEGNHTCAQWSARICTSCC